MVHILPLGPGSTARKVSPAFELPSRSLLAPLRVHSFLFSSAAHAPGRGETVFTPSVHNGVHSHRSLASDHNVRVCFSRLRCSACQILDFSHLHAAVRPRNFPQILPVDQHKIWGILAKSRAESA